MSLTEAGKSESEKVKVTVSPYLNITDVGEAKSESSTGTTGKQSMVTTVTLDKDDVEKAAKESDVLAIGEEKALAEGDEFAEVRVSKDGFKLLADAEKPVDVKTSRGSIRLPVDDVKALADLPVENIVFDIGVEQEAGDDLDTDEINASKMVEIDLTDGEGGNLAEAGNGLGLSLAVTLKTDMAEPQEGRAAAVWYLDGDNLDDQELLYFDGAKDGEDGEISWTATHFSTYIFGSKIVVNPPVGTEYPDPVKAVFTKDGGVYVWTDTNIEWAGNEVLYDVTGDKGAHSIVSTTVGDDGKVMVRVDTGTENVEIWIAESIEWNTETLEYDTYGTLDYFQMVKE